MINKLIRELPAADSHRRECVLKHKLKKFCCHQVVNWQARIPEYFSVLTDNPVIDRSVTKSSKIKSSLDSLFVIEQVAA